MKNKNKKITIKDIAERTGVSTTTVSFAFNNPQRVNPDTLQKILKVSKELNYIPNIMAGALRGKSNVIVIIVNSHYDEMTDNPTIMEGFPLILKLITALGYYAMPFFQSSNEYENSNLLSMIRHKQIAGAFFLASRSDLSVLDLLVRNKIPVAAIGTILSYQDKIYSIDNDNEKNVYDVTCRLYDMGYKKIAYISGDLDYFVCKQRLKGYETAVLERNIQKPLVYGFSDDKEEIQQFVKSIITSSENVDVIITKDDVKGLYTIAELHKNNIKVGEDIGVVSIGGSKVSTYSNPELTVLQFSIDEIVKKAVQNLDCQIQNEKIIIKRDIVPVTFLNRNSLKSMS